MNTVCLSPNGLDVHALQGPPERVFAGTMDGIVELRRGGSGGWSVARSALAGVHVSSLVHDASDGAVFAGSHDRGLFRSLVRGHRAGAPVPQRGPGRELAGAARGAQCALAPELELPGAAARRARQAHHRGPAQRGITLFDTAARYGEGASETNLGRTLRELRARPVVATKVCIDIVHLHNSIGAARAGRANVGADMQLGIDDVLGARGVAEAFACLRARGLIRAAGLCAFGGEMPSVAAALASGAFDSLLVHYSLRNCSAWEAGARAAIRFALADPRVSSALVGLFDLEQVEIAARAVDAGPPAHNNRAPRNEENGS